MLLVLWDIDGTLVDSAGQGRRAFEDAFEEVFGRPLDVDVPFAGRTDHEIALAVLERNGVAGGGAHVLRVHAALADALVAREPQIRAEGRAQPGARQALEALDARDGVVQSVLTGNIAANAAVKLGAFGLERLLELDLGGYGSDPHAARSDLVAVARERAAARHGPADEVVLVGDTPLDVQAAREAGARAVAVASGFGDEEELRESRPDALLPDLRDTAAVVAAVSPST